MSRGEKRRRIGMMGAMIGMLITGGLVLAFFSLMPHATIQGEWPLGIHDREVARYAEVADLRRIEKQLAEPKGEAFMIGGAARSSDCQEAFRTAGWTRRWFEAQGYGDSVLVRPTTTINGGVEIRFKDDLPFRGQQGVLLHPANAESIRMKYAEVLARELGLATPVIGFVRLVACGREMGTYVVEEVIGEGFLARRRFSEAVLFKQSFDPERPDQLYPGVIGDTVQAPLLRAMLALLQEDAARERLEKLGHTLDDQAATAWLLMHWLEGASDPLHQENVFAFHWNRGRFTPLHRPARDHGGSISDTPAPWALNVFTPWLKVPSFREALERRRLELASKEVELRELFAAADSMWLPVLASEEPLAAVTGTADRVKQQIFSRMHEGDMIAFLDRPMVPGPGMAAIAQGQEVARRYWPTESDVDGVQAIARKYKARLEGDSIVFPRGKYAIDEDLIIPQGYALILLSGARITMAPGRNILCQGSLFIRGTKLNPVFIRPGGAAFGTVAMMGDGDTPSMINGLQISGGAGARINGVQHPGMLSIQDASSTRFKDCVISSSAGEIAVFVQGGELEMEDCTLITSRMELRDVNGAIRRSVFQGGTRGAGAGGLLVNASRLKLSDTRFWAVQGVAFEGGDGARVIISQSHFSQCGTAVLAADLAEVHLQGNELNGNRTALQAERRKPLYGGAKIFVYQNTFLRNANERVADEHSSITDQERFNDRVLEGEVVER